MKGAASIFILMCPRRPDGTSFCVHFRNLEKQTIFQSPRFWRRVKTRPIKKARQTYEDQETPQTWKQRDGSRKDNAPTTQTQFIIWPVNWIPSQLAVSAGICGFKHVTFDTAPFSSWGLLTPTHPPLSLGSNHFPHIPFNNLTTLITLVNIASSSRSLKHPAAAGVNDQLSDTWRVFALCRHGGNMSDWTANGRLLGARPHSGHCWHAIIWTVFRGATFLRHQKATARHNWSHAHFDTLEREHYTAKGAVMFLHLHTSDQHRSPATSNAHGCTPEGTRPPTVAPGN